MTKHCHLKLFMMVSVGQILCESCLNSSEPVMEGKFFVFVS